MMIRNPRSLAPLAAILIAALTAMPAAAANSVAASQAARLGPNTSMWGLQVTLQDVSPRNPTYVMAGPGQGFNNETTLRGTFFVDPQGITMAQQEGMNSFQMVDFLEGVNPNDRVQLIFHLYKDPATGNFHINVWHWNSTLNGGLGNWQFSGGGFLALPSPSWRNNRVDFSWNAGNPGRLTLWRTLYSNGAPHPSGTIQMFSVNLPGQQNAVINYVFAGMFASHDPGTSGILYLDGFSFSR